KSHTLRRFVMPLALMLGMAGFTVAHSSDFPSKPIRIVVGFGPGVGMEVSTRLLADELAKEIGQPVIVENKPGASTMIAASAVAQDPRSAYTLLMRNIQTGRNERRYSNVWCMRSDFIPLAVGGMSRRVMSLSTAVSPSTGRASIVYATRRAREMCFAHSG